MRGQGETLEGADILTNIAAEDPVAQQRAQRSVNAALMLNRQVADAAAGIQHMRLREGVGGAGR